MTEPRKVDLSARKHPRWLVPGVERHFLGRYAVLMYQIDEKANRVHRLLSKRHLVSCQETIPCRPYER